MNPHLPGVPRDDLADADLESLNAYLDGELDGAPREELERRLQGDPALREELCALRALDAELRESLAPPSVESASTATVSAADREVVAAAFRAARGSRSRPPDPRPSRPPTPAAEGARRSRVPRRAGALAAGALLAVGAFLAGRHLGGLSGGSPAAGARQTPRVEQVIGTAWLVGQAGKGMLAGSDAMPTRGTVGLTDDALVELALPGGGLLRFAGGSTWLLGSEAALGELREGELWLRSGAAPRTLRLPGAVVRCDSESEIDIFCAGSQITLVVLRGAAELDGELATDAAEHVFAGEMIYTTSERALGRAAVILPAKHRMWTLPLARAYAAEMRERAAALVAVLADGIGTTAVPILEEHFGLPAVPVLVAYLERDSALTSEVGRERAANALLAIVAGSAAGDRSSGDLVSRITPRLFGLVSECEPRLRGRLVKCIAEITGTAPPSALDLEAEGPQRLAALREALQEWERAWRADAGSRRQ